MSVNSSSNDSLPDLHDINSNLPAFLYCLTTPPSSFIFTSYSITHILLLLPLCTFIFYLGLQQWRLKRSTSSAVTMSHSDSFSYHLVTVELVGVFGCFLCCGGVYMEDPKLVLVGSVLYSYIWYGESFFHVLTCVERYLAVVHPVTYLGLRRERGTRIRNISIGCVWLLCLAGMGLMNEHVFIILHFFLLALSFIIISFCSISVLCVLIRPGPGQQGGGRERVDQSKQRAFYILMAILGALLLKFASSTVWAILKASVGTSNCLVTSIQFWFNLPSSLVLPLLFLHRAGKLVCWRINGRTG